MKQSTRRPSASSSTATFKASSDTLFKGSSRKGSLSTENIPTFWPSTGNIFDSSNMSAQSSLDDFRQFKNIIKNLQSNIPRAASHSPSQTSASQPLSSSSSKTIPYINSATSGQFQGAAPHPQELERLEMIKKLKMEEADIPPYDNLTRLASNVTACPISCVSLVEADRQWFKSHHGTDLAETPREQSFCAHAILEEMEIFEIEDATRDERFKNNPLTTGPAQVIYYAGVPLKSTAGLPMGALCVIDSKPRKLDMQQRINLLMIAKQTQTEIELRELIIKYQEQAAVSKNLLLNVLPNGIVERLLVANTSEDVVIADSFQAASVIFADIVNFTQYASFNRVEDLIQTLGRLFTRFDKCTHVAGATKIKTIGDGYLAVTGVPNSCANHAQRAVECAILFLDALKEFNEKYDQNIQIRVGIHSGPLMAGVVGFEKFTYDIFGDSVNIASRIESAGSPGRIHISQTTFELIKDIYQCHKRSELTSLKGRGHAQTYFVLRKISPNVLPLPSESKVTSTNNTLSTSQAVDENTESDVKDVPPQASNTDDRLTRSSF